MTLLCCCFAVRIVVLSVLWEYNIEGLYCWDDVSFPWMVWSKKGLDYRRLLGVL